MVIGSQGHLGYLLSVPTPSTVPRSLAAMNPTPSISVGLAWLDNVAYYRAGGISPWDNFAGENFATFLNGEISPWRNPPPLQLQIPSSVPFNTCAGTRKQAVGPGAEDRLERLLSASGVSCGILKAIRGEVPYPTTFGCFSIQRVQGGEGILCADNFAEPPNLV